MDRFAVDGDDSMILYEDLIDALRLAEDPVMGKLKNKLKGIKGGEAKLRGLLNDADVKGRERVTRRDFRMALLEEMGLDLKIEEVKEMTNKFESAEEEGMVDIHVFLEALFGPGKKASNPLDGVLEKILLALKKEGRKPTSLRPKLERADERAKGVISRRAFERVLGELELDLDTKELGVVEAAYDKRKEETVAYMDFCDRLEEMGNEGSSGDSNSSRGSGKDVAHDSMAYLMELLRRAAEKGVDLLESFEFFDIDKSGTIDEHEFRSGLKKLGVVLTRAQVEEVMSKFEGKKSGMEESTIYHLI